MPPNQTPSITPQQTLQPVDQNPSLRVGLGQLRLHDCELFFTRPATTISNRARRTMSMSSDAGRERGASEFRRLCSSRSNVDPFARAAHTDDTCPLIQCSQA
ncbi:MAG: hypothetical protein R3C56_03405 [Pirellulaceae bacterium]